MIHPNGGGYFPGHQQIHQGEEKNLQEIFSEAESLLEKSNRSPDREALAEYAAHLDEMQDPAYHGLEKTGGVRTLTFSHSDNIAALKSIIGASGNIVFFGGAGVSTESGIPDFRSAGGLFSERVGRLSPEEILSHTFFMNHTEEFYEFYRSKMIYRDAKPNDAHLALARLERAGKLKAVITQNIDGLHQLAGSREVLELHGSVHRNYCMNCNRFFGLDHVLAAEGVPTCDECGGIVKPDVVLYEEALDMAILEKSRRYIEQADVLIVAGTSPRVYPAAGLIQYFGGSHLVLINKSPTPYDHAATLVINGSIGETLNQALN